LSFLHNDVYLPDCNVMPNLRLGHSLDGLLDIADSYSSTQRVKVFAGYAGWSAGQLDGELERDTWMTHPASLELIFHPQPQDLWQIILRVKGWKYRMIAEGPEDPSWN
jgi:putative transcriptional regulator